MYILNDKSVDKQFNTVDEFLDSLVDNTIPLFKLLDRKDGQVLKSDDIYDLEIINGKKLIEVITSKRYPEVSRFKSLLAKILIDNPYWNKSNSCDDCIEKAAKENLNLISFEHEDFLLEELTIGKKLLFNSYNKYQLEENLFKKNQITLREIILSRYSGIVAEFCLIDGKDYFNILIELNKLNLEDLKNIKRDILIFLDLVFKQEDLGKYHKSIGNGLEEFRTRISSSRQIRILYTVFNGKIFFLNAFHKKTVKIPSNEKKLGDILMKEIKK